MALESQQDAACSSAQALKRHAEPQQRPSSVQRLVWTKALASEQPRRALERRRRVRAEFRQRQHLQALRDARRGQAQPARPRPALLRVAPAA